MTQGKLAIAGLLLSCTAAQAQVIALPTTGRNAIFNVVKSGAELRSQIVTTRMVNGKAQRVLLNTFQAKEALILCTVAFEGTQLIDWDTADCNTLTTRENIERGLGAPASNPLVKEAPAKEPAKPVITPAVPKP